MAIALIIVILILFSLLYLLWKRVQKFSFVVKAANVDLVLSGHTHGGQFLLLRAIMEIFHINDQVYGHTHGGNTDFIVSSGIADWALRFRTGPSSEYVVIDISETAASSLK